MRIRVMLEKQDKEGADRQSIGVELHVRRGDTYNVETARQIIEGDELVIEMPANGRVTLKGSVDETNVVYNRETMANELKQPDDSRTRFVDEDSTLGKQEPKPDVMKPVSSQPVTGQPTPVLPPGSAGLGEGKATPGSSDAQNLDGQTSATNQSSRIPVDPGAPGNDPAKKPEPDAPTSGGKTIRG